MMVLNNDEKDEPDSWVNIDFQLLLKIAKYIPPSCLPRLGQVCSRWHKVLIPILWQNVYLGFGQKPNKLDLLKKYGKHIRYLEAPAMEFPLPGEPNWLDNCPRLWYYNLHLFSSNDIELYGLLSDKKIPKDMEPIPIFFIFGYEHWIVLDMLCKSLNPSPIIERFILDSFDYILALQSLPSHMKQNLEILDIDIQEYFLMSHLVELIQELPNLKSLILYLNMESNTENWFHIQELLSNVGSLNKLDIGFELNQYQLLYDREVPWNESYILSTSIKSLDFGLKYSKSNKSGLSNFGLHNHCNFFELVILSCPELTELTIPVVDNRILSLLSKHCPNLTKLSTQTPLPLFGNVNTFKYLTHLSTPSLDNLYQDLVGEFTTIFPNVIKLNIDHYFNHQENHCTNHSLFLLPKLFPKLTSLKLSHDICDKTLSTLLEMDDSLHLTHLYLYSTKNTWTNLIELIQQNCPELQTIIYDWSTQRRPFEDCPIHMLKDKLPHIDYFVGKLTRPFEFTNIYHLDDYLNRTINNTSKHY